MEDDKKREHLVSWARCQDKTKPCVWQTHTYTRTLSHTVSRTHTQTFIHAYTLKPACPRICKQAKKKKKKIPPRHTHTCALHPLCRHSRSRVQLERKKKKKAKIGCDWGVHWSYKTNLHTQRLRSEYAWENKTICLQADHPLSLDYCTHLRAFYLFVGMQSSWFSVHWLMVPHNGLDLRDANLLRESVTKANGNFEKICTRMILEGFFVRFWFACYN